jgi:hypothetical protein
MATRARVTRASDGDGVTESVVRECIITHSGRASAKWAAVASQGRERDGEGEMGLLAWSSTRPDAGVFIADAICTRQVHYGMTGELLFHVTFV